MRTPLRALQVSVAAALLALLSVSALAVISTAPTYVTHWDGSAGAAGVFNEPVALDVDADGNVYVVDRKNYRIQKFDNDGSFVTAWGSYTPSAVPGKFKDPYGIAVDRTMGYVYVADRLLSNVQKFDTSGGWMDTWTTFNSGDSLQNPSGLAVDPENGDVLIADVGKHRIVRLHDDGAFGAIIGGIGFSPGQFYFGPADVAIDPSTHAILAADNSTGVARIQVFDETGMFQFTWGIPGAGPGEFNQPLGIAVDEDGSVFVADFGNNRIQAFDTAGVYAIEWDASADPGGAFFNPQGVAIGPGDNVFVADTGNNQIQKFAKEDEGGGGDLFPIDLSPHRVKIWQRGRLKDKFWVHGFLTLDSESDGLNLPDEDVSLTIGSDTSDDVTFAIPAGSFRSYVRGRLLRFRGRIGDTRLTFYLFKRRSWNGCERYWMVVTGWKASFGAISSPVSVSVVMGNDGGTAENVKAFIR